MEQAASREHAVMTDQSENQIQLANRKTVAMQMVSGKIAVCDSLRPSLSLQFILVSVFIIIRVFL